MNILGGMWRWSAMEPGNPSVEKMVGDDRLELPTILQCKTKRC